MIDVQSSGIPELLHAFKVAEATTVTRVRRRTVDFGKAVIKDSRAYVRARAYDTGSLHRALHSRTTRTRPKTVGLEMGVLGDSPRSNPGDKNAREYAHFVHDGTVKMAPRPFLDEPFKRHYPDYEADLLEEMVNI